MTGHGLSVEEQRRIRNNLPYMNPFIRKTFELMLYENMTYDEADKAARIWFAFKDEGGKSE